MTRTVTFDVMTLSNLQNEAVYLNKIKRNFIFGQAMATVYETEMRVYI